MFEWLKGEIGPCPNRDKTPKSPININIRAPEPKQKLVKKIPEDSVEAMIFEAERQGWLEDRDFGMISELTSIYRKASKKFFELIDESDSRYRETFVHHTCRYLFAKSVEGVILWGASPDGRISINFHPNGMTGKIDTDLPPQLNKFVIESMAVGESLFKAHQSYVIMKCKTDSENIDIQVEIAKTILWIPKFGISYALSKNYQSLWER